jgi:hypothetical protein
MFKRPLVRTGHFYYGIAEKMEVQFTGIKNLGRAGHEMKVMTSICLQWIEDIYRETRKQLLEPGEKIWSKDTSLGNHEDTGENFIGQSMKWAFYKLS